METMNVSYTNEFESLLKDESEKAEAMSILHSMSHAHFNKLSVGVNIPVIILSSLIGFLSPLTLFNDQAILLGALSIIVAIAKTVDSYMDFTKRTETHRVIGLNYAKISKFIQIQLSLEKDCRINAKDLLDYIQNDLQNLKDQEPIISQKIIQAFNIRYKSEPTSKPSITNGLTVVKINKQLASAPSSPEVLLTLPETNNISEASLSEAPKAAPKKPIWK
jgi:hypothetical protein